MNDAGKIFVKSEENFHNCFRGSCYSALDHKSTSSKHSNVRDCGGVNHILLYYFNLVYNKNKKYKPWAQRNKRKQKNNAIEN
jgi:hypothetical protein